MSFLLRKVEDVTTISKSQSLTLVGIKDCTLRVPNKTTTLFLLWAIIKVIFILRSIFSKHSQIQKYCWQQIKCFSAQACCLVGVWRTHQQTASQRRAQTQHLCLIQMPSPYHWMASPAEVQSRTSPAMDLQAQVKSASHIGDHYWSSPWFSNKQHYLLCLANLKIEQQAHLFEGCQRSRKPHQEERFICEGS